MTLPGKFCKDCAHVRIDRDQDAYLWTCSKTRTYSPVTGEAKYFTCGYTRSPDDLCGPTGAWWERKI